MTALIKGDLSAPWILLFVAILVLGIYISMTRFHRAIGQKNVRVGPVGVYLGGSGHEGDHFVDQNMFDPPSVPSSRLF